MPKTKPLMATDSGVVLSPRSEGSDLEEPAFEFEKPQETLDVSQLCNMDQWDVDTTKEWLERQGKGLGVYKATELYLFIVK